MLESPADEPAGLLRADSAAVPADSAHPGPAAAAPSGVTPDIGQPEGQEPEADGQLRASVLEGSVQHGTELENGIPWATPAIL